MENTIKVIIIDDHEIVRDGISLLIKKNPLIEVVGEVSDGGEFFGLLKNNCMPDIIILDIDLPDISGIEIAKIIVKEYPKIKIIMFSGSFQENIIYEALEAGAIGFVTKNSMREELLEAVEMVHNDKPFLSSFIPNDTLVKYIRKEKNENKYAFDETKKLSSREIDVLKLLANGLSYKEVATKLFISARTVESHKKNIEEKLELNSMVDLLKYAIKNKLTEI